MEILCWFVFLLFTGATALAFPKLMGMLIDCVKNKDNDQANPYCIGFNRNLISTIYFFFFQIIIICEFY